jgi:ParB family chromosome partitioning protein
VANTLRLLKLSEPVKQLVRQGKLSAGHARLLVGQPNAEKIAHEVIAKGWTVRQLEDDMRKDGAAQARAVKREGKGHASGAKDADTRALEKRLSDALGLEVTVDHRGEGGTLHIKYRNLDQLDAVLKKLGR